MTSGIALFFTGMKYEAFQGGKNDTRYDDGKGTLPLKTYGKENANQRITKIAIGQNRLIRFFIFLLLEFPKFCVGDEYAECLIDAFYPANGTSPPTTLPDK
jgi:hypothetical protein